MSGLGFGSWVAGGGVDFRSLCVRVQGPGLRVYRSAAEVDTAQKAVSAGPIECICVLRQGVWVFPGLEVRQS